MEKKSNWQEYKNLIEQQDIGILYHFTDRDNLESIISNGGIKSWADCNEKSIKINKPGGDNLSRQLDIRDGMQNYVRVSFVKNHPMMFVAIDDCSFAVLSNNVSYK